MHADQAHGTALQDAYVWTDSALAASAGLNDFSADLLPDVPFNGLLDGTDLDGSAIFGTGSGNLDCSRSMDRGRGAFGSANGSCIGSPDNNGRGAAVQKSSLAGTQLHAQPS